MVVPSPALSRPPMQPDPAKRAMRAELRAERDAFVAGLAPGERAALGARAAARLLPLLDGAHCVAFYMARGSELDCGAAITDAASRGIAVALPYVSGPQQQMLFLAWQPGAPLEAGWRGLLQPPADSPESVPDIIVAPLLGFDSAGRRLGQGAGYYDRAFAGLAAVRKIGLGWSIQQRPVIACDPWDVPLDAVVTEAGTIGGNEAR